MLSLPASVRVYVASEPIDMRRGHDGLFAVVKSWGLDPFSGDLYGFIGKRRDRVKVLVWHRGGFVLLYNQPSSHYTSFDLRRRRCGRCSFAVSSAARSASRSHRLECLVGRSAGAS